MATFTSELTRVPPSAQATIKRLFASPAVFDGPGGLVATLPISPGLRPIPSAGSASWRHRQLKLPQRPSDARSTVTPGPIVEDTVTR